MAHYQGWCEMRWVRLRIPFLLLVLVMTTAACGVRDGDGGGDGPDADVNVTDADNGKSYTVKVGDHISIALASNPTTGYEWAVQNVETTIISYQGSEYDGSNSGLVGAGGTQTLTFRAELPGDSPIELKYWRSFEGDSSIGQTFTIQVKVDPA
jgi:inhibitor of cysteine peptidase